MWPTGEGPLPCLHAKISHGPRRRLAGVRCWRKGMDAGGSRAKRGRRTASSRAPVGGRETPTGLRGDECLSPNGYGTHKVTLCAFGAGLGKLV